MESQVCKLALHPPDRAARQALYSESFIRLSIFVNQNVNRRKPWVQTQLKKAAGSLRQPFLNKQIQDALIHHTRF